MKNRIIICCLFSAILCSNVFGQSRTYLKFEPGYGSNLIKNTLSIESNSTRTGVVNTTGTSKAIEGSLTSGLNLALHVGREFDAEGNLSGELGFLYINGNKVEAEQRHSIEGNGTFITNQFSKSSAQLTTMGLTLGLKMRTKTRSDALRLFFRPGIFVPLRSRVVSKSFSQLKFSDRENPSELSYREELKLGMVIGFSTAMGAELKLTEKIGFFAQLQGMLVNLPSKSSETTAYESKSGSQTTRLEDLTVSQRKKEFRKEVKLEGEPDPDKPGQRIRTFAPIGFIGANMGIRIDF